MTDQNIILTSEEQRAIKNIKRYLKKWSDSLDLFSWSGTLCVLKNQCLVDTIDGIYVDGGDPSDDEINQSPNITYE